MLFQPESEYHCSVIYRRMTETIAVIARARQKTSTFSMAGRAVTQIGGLPFAAGKGVVHGGGAVASGVGHGLGSVGGFAGRRIGLLKKKDTQGRDIVVPAPVGDGGSVANGSPAAAAYNVPAGQVSQPAENGLGGVDGMNGTNGANGANGMVDGVPAGGAATTLPPGVGQPPSEGGTLSVTVISAKDLKSEEGAGAKPYVQLKMGQKVHKTEHHKGLQPEW